MKTPAPSTWLSILITPHRLRLALECAPAAHNTTRQSPAWWRNLQVADGGANWKEISGMDYRRQLAASGLTLRRQHGKRVLH